MTFADGGLASGSLRDAVLQLNADSGSADDTIQLLARDPCEISVAEVTRLYLRDDKDQEKMRRALQIKALPEGWRNYFAEQVEQPER